MPAASYADYARLMLALPGTAAEVASRIGMTHKGVSVMLRRFDALGLVCAGQVVREPRTNIAVAVWQAGAGLRHPALRCVNALRPKATQIAFATVWRALEAGDTAHGLAAETGVAEVSVYRVLQVLHAGKVARISGWARDALNRPVAVWSFGAERNAPRPKPQTAGQKHRAYRQRALYRALGAATTGACA